MDMEGQKVLITGSSRGIGRAYAGYFAAQGASLILTASERSEQSLEAFAGQLRSSGVSVDTLISDVRDLAQKLSERLVETGGLQAFVHNAGSVQDASIMKMSEQAWQEVYETHLLSAFRLSRCVWPYFREQGYGRILFTTSSAGLYGNFGQANYGAAKMGVIGLAKSLALEGARKGIKVNCIAPLASTQMNEQILDKDVAARVPAESLCPLAAYLCHPDCKESGSVFEAAGGWCAKVHIGRGRGRQVAVGTMEAVHRSWREVCSTDDLCFPQSAQDDLDDLVKRL